MENKKAIVFFFSDNVQFFFSLSAKVFLKLCKCFKPCNSCVYHACFYSCLDSTGAWPLGVLTYEQLGIGRWG